MRKQVIKKQETAVNFLVDQLDTKFPELDWDKVEKAIQKAKQMEMEQVIDAWEDGQNSFSSRNAEQYYTETFKK